MTDTPKLIVGIGASAGGIPALEQFFRALPHDSGMAFVIITHLSPDRESQLHRVVANYTDLTVRVAEDGALLERDTVHVMPQNAILTMDDGRLRMQTADIQNRERKPVDVFLVSLAADQADRAAGIILSGGDSDGTLGVKAIREAGGVTMAQIPDGQSGPSNPEMPISAIGTGMVDFALPAALMPDRLMSLAASRGEDADSDGLTADLTPAVQADIAAILRNQTGHDFAGYKPRTFLRRVMRRMKVTQAVTAASYVDLLRATPSEIPELFNDLLINVTNFFRDAEAFAALKAEVIPRLFADRGADETIRIWVPGCATGEEAYSLAILVREEMAERSYSPRVQIFATDIDENALAIARAGRYPEPLLKGVDAARVRRFFHKEGASLVVNKDVREMCIFSAHNLISDPPLSRMDLVSCRNLLIYLGNGLQAKVIPTLHYALRAGGFLFLGASEGVSGFSELFSHLNKKQRIYEARVTTQAPRRLPIRIGEQKPRMPRLDLSGAAPEPPRLSLAQSVEAQVIEHHAPAHVVVTPQGEVMHFSPRITAFLEVPKGAPNRNLFEVAQRELRLDLRTLLRQVQETGQAARRNVLFGTQPLSIIAEPLQGNTPLLLVLFERRDAVTAEHLPQVKAATAEERDDKGLRDRLQMTIEEYENALEELKAANEELMSANEEVQSTNEELEASKEEMQSLNEELSTINAELNASVEDLALANTDLKNLYAASRIATVFLDADLVIRHFTPAASDLFRIRASDVGRPLTDLAGMVDHADIQPDIAEVFRSGEITERRLVGKSGVHYLVRLVPYRDNGDRIGGVVLAFVDITSMAQAEAQQNLLIAELDHRVKNMLAVVVSIVMNSAKNRRSPEEFSSVLIGRLNAMARAHALLARASWQDVHLEEIIRLEAECHGAGRIVAAGPDLRLPALVAMPVAMAIHELATNASKYGALSVKEGQVRIAWQLQDGWVRLDWAERDGPAPERAPVSGFGLGLIEGQIGYQLGGRCDIRFDPQGLSVTMEFPLKRSKNQERKNS